MCESGKSGESGKTGESGDAKNRTVGETFSPTISRWKKFIYYKKMENFYLLVDEKFSSTKSRLIIFIYL